MATTRHIRNLLDANATPGGSPINSSTSLKIVSKYINAAKVYWYNNGFSAAFSTTPGVNGTKAGWNAVYLMGDSNPGGTNPPLYETPSATNNYLGDFPEGHGVYAYDTYTLAGNATHQFTTFGQSTTTTYSNSGLRHLAHQVQFAKGVSSWSTMPVAFNSSGFMTGTVLGVLWGVREQVGTTIENSDKGFYKTSNIRFSDFRGLTKDGQQSNYIWGDNVSKTTPTSGQISIGDAATINSLPS
jgi:hypothetical protein